MFKDIQKVGGIAALVHAVTLVTAMILGFTLMLPLLDAAPDEAMRFLSSHHTRIDMEANRLLGIGHYFDNHVGGALQSV